MKRMWSKNELKNIADDRVQALVEGGALDNAKPIYYHGLEYYQSNVALAYMVILNNMPDGIDTLQKFLDWITGFDTLVVVKACGVVKISGAYKELYSLFKRANSDNINLIVSDATTGYTLVENVDLSTLFTTFNDGVNKIN